MERAINREIELYKNFLPKHPNIVEYYRDYEDDESFYLIL